mmetsp:Transcript_42346/g.135589  ORF Transcript_42346/g.135589 Transcript_42346/m.135589 type:complete len:283 (+) Transcript_42346:472-1320(+)
MPDRARGIPLRHVHGGGEGGVLLPLPLLLRFAAALTREALEEHHEVRHPPLPSHLHPRALLQHDVPEAPRRVGLGLDSVHVVRLLEDAAEGWDSIAFQKPLDAGVILRQDVEAADRGRAPFDAVPPPSQHVDQVRDAAVLVYLHAELLCDREIPEAHRRVGAGDGDACPIRLGDPKKLHEVGDCNGHLTELGDERELIEENGCAHPGAVVWPREQLGNGRELLHPREVVDDVRSDVLALCKVLEAPHSIVLALLAAVTHQGHEVPEAVRLCNLDFPGIALNR